MTLEALIKKRIQQFGPISVADYMALCLSHPEHGYYMKRDPLGKEGDFTTAPEISQIFGELLGLWMAAQWQKQGKPKALLVELGPGRGTLINDVLRSTKKVVGFHENISVHLVEISPTLKQKQWKTLAGKHERISWHEDISELPDDAPIFFLANEFFDALPIRQFIENNERMIGLDDGGALTFLPSTKHQALSTIFETCEPAQTIISHLASRIVKQGGAGLVVDYGYTDGAGDTLQAMKNHAYAPVLETPGEADLTAHVDFTALKKAALSSGASVFGAIPQGKFLLQIGASQRLMNLCLSANETQKQSLMSGFERLISHEAMGELFKVMALLPSGVVSAEGF